MLQPTLLSYIALSGRTFFLFGMLSRDLQCKQVCIAFPDGIGSRGAFSFSPDLHLACIAQLARYRCSALFNSKRSPKPGFYFPQGLHPS